MHSESDKLTSLVSSVFKFWDSGIDRQWFELIKRGLIKNGLLYYEDEQSQRDARLCVIASAVIYSEACYRLGYDAEIKHWNSMNQTVLDDLSHDLEAFDEAYFKVTQSLNKFFGNERELTKEFYLNAKQGYLYYNLRLHELITLKAEAEDLLYKDDSALSQLYTYFYDTKSSGHLQSVFIPSSPQSSNNV